MSPRIPFALLILPLLSLTVNARPHPCNTLIISTFTFSLHPNPNPNPSGNLLQLPIHRHADVISVITTSNLHRDFLPHHHHHHLRHRFFLPRHHPQRTQQNNGEFLGFASLKDVLSIVASLLLGAACGALTAATMYLICALFNRRSYHDNDGDDHDDPDSDVFNPKKNGYVAIPTPLVAEADPSVAPAKEST